MGSETAPIENVIEKQMVLQILFSQTIFIFFPMPQYTLYLSVNGVRQIVTTTITTTPTTTTIISMPWFLSIIRL